jgi:hypothetical protein
VLSSSLPFLFHQEIAKKKDNIKRFDDIDKESKNSCTRWNSKTNKNLCAARNYLKKNLKYTSLRKYEQTIATKSIIICYLIIDTLEFWIFR